MAATDDGRRRVVIEGVSPEVDCGRFPVKRSVGELLAVEADVFTDGHDAVRAVLLHRREEDAEWTRTEMEPLANDRWRAAFAVGGLGRCRYTVEGWVDHYLTWRRDLVKRVDAGQDVRIDLLIGAELVEQAAGRAGGEDATRLGKAAVELRDAPGDTTTLALLDELDPVISRYPDRRYVTAYGRELAVSVDPPYAGCSAWYELFPRSLGEGGRHGTLADVERALDYVAGMGFDVLYLPPVHPIGQAHRKGRNNAVEAQKGDVGSPWAIGAPEGGHDAVHPELGTAEDVERLAKSARERGIELALDIAFQASPDHPYVRSHAEWFRRRPDGTIQYAENPPKKYQDIYPFDFESEDWQGLWDELLRVVLVWVERGVRVFRVDNPHTKPFAFWERLIGEVRERHPEVIFLAEAFTRPRVMYRLAKLGFNQSYTYFAWRNAKHELVEYLTELTKGEVRDYFRPNFWPNTPDILTEHLQTGARPAFMARLVLAATLAANYGIYGPAFELGENRPREWGSEEYLDSEKYQLRRWDLERPDSLRHLIARVNRVRREHPALQSDRHLEFHGIDNDALLAYSKRTADHDDVVLCIVNLDPHATQSGWTSLWLEELGIEEAAGAYQVHDLISGARYLWQGAHNFVELDPQAMPAHVFALRRRLRNERDFDYYN